MFLANNNVVILPELKQENMDYEKIVHDLELQNEEVYEAIPVNGVKKRIRLHQLSWEEKLLRKKLRNRIAAQTSRDRKKAKMDHLEESVRQLKEQNDQLLEKVEELTNRNEKLMITNEELQNALKSRLYTCTCKKLEGDKVECGEKSKNIFQGSASVKSANSFQRPAESYEIPQQKGKWAILAQVLTKTASWKLWQIFLLYLLSQKCWKISRKKHSSMTLSDWQQVCWKKWKTMSTSKTPNPLSMRLQELAEKNSLLIKKWWGPHQKGWNPVKMIPKQMSTKPLFALTHHCTQY